MKTVFNKDNMPRIGIRPTIDGRLGGVRESLEDQTMNQAKATAAFISENLRYPDGSPVECVIADTCIGGVAERIPVLAVWPRPPPVRTSLKRKTSASP